VASRSGSTTRSSEPDSNSLSKLSVDRTPGSDPPRP
jgi:hypothetical protein